MGELVAQYSLNGTAHSLFRTAGGIVVGSATIAADADDTNVAGIGMLFVNSNGGNIVLGGLVGGVSGQIIHVVKIDGANNVTLEDDEGTGNQDFKTPDGNDLVLSNNSSVTICCNGTNWFIMQDI